MFPGSCLHPSLYVQVWFSLHLFLKLGLHRGAMCNVQHAACSMLPDATCNKSAACWKKTWCHTLLQVSQMKQQPNGRCMWQYVIWTHKLAVLFHTVTPLLLVFGHIHCHLTSTIQLLFQYLQTFPFGNFERHKHHFLSFKSSLVPLSLCSGIICWLLL
jgi:hypothetical protein